MKTKQFSKKMVLNKETVANLENKMMNAVRGGAETVNPKLCTYRTVEDTICRTGCVTRCTACM